MFDAFLGGVCRARDKGADGCILEGCFRALGLVGSGGLVGWAHGDGLGVLEGRF